MRQADLLTVWRNVRRFPAWLSGVTETLGISKEDESFLVEQEESHIIALRGMRDRWARNYERPVVDKQWALDRSSEYLEHRLEELKSAAADCRRQMALAVRDDDEFYEAMATKRLEDVITAARKITGEIKNRVWDSEREGQITEDMIDRARKFPIAEYLKTEKKQIACPLHEDKNPSGSVAKGFFFCFSCGVSMNTLDWAIRIDGLDFPTAVLRLQ